MARLFVMAVVVSRGKIVIDALLGINLIVSLLIFVLGIVLTGFIPYLLGYRFFGRTADGKAKEVANILFRG